jgi:hypothetical protein
MSNTVDLIPIRWILASLFVVTLYFQSTLADPFNSPKLWILLIFAAWLTGYIFTFRKTIFVVKPVNRLFILVFVFLVFLLILI